MSLRSEKVLKAWLERRPEEERVALERFLPDEERMLLTELPPFEMEDTIPTEIHWSWFLPILIEAPAEMQSVYLHAFNAHDASRLSEALGIKPAQVNDIARPFLYSELLRHLQKEDIIPLEFLPASSLKRLLSLTKKNLIRLIDCLSLYDFAFEFRQILETKNLKKIYSFLSDEQREILGKIAPPKECKYLPELGLARWNGDEADLKSLLHRRGLAKLGIALSAEDPDLQWIICHQLDSGRGSNIMKFVGKEQTPYAEIVRKQIEELMSLL